MILSILGALLIVSKSSRIRLTAFIIWIVADIYWIIFAVTLALQIQFGLFLLLAIWGVINNWNGNKL